MKRNVEKIIAEYKSKHGRRPRAWFSVNDFCALDDMSGGKKWDAIWNTYKFAYTLGYRHGKQDGRKKARTAKG